MKDLLEILQSYGGMGNTGLLILYSQILLIIIICDVGKHLRWKWRNVINLVGLCIIVMFCLTKSIRLCACDKGAFLGLVDKWIMRILISYQVIITILNALISRKLSLFKIKKCEPEDLSNSDSAAAKPE